MTFQDNWTGRGVEEYYKRFIELQERLRKSEEERLLLEMKFNGMIQVTQEEEQLYFKRLKTQYKQFMEENHKRRERNEKILVMLERIESRAAIFEAKSKRLKLLRNQYHAFLNRVERERNFRLKENATVDKNNATLSELIDHEVPKVTATVAGTMQIGEKQHKYNGLGTADQLLSRFKEQSTEDTIADEIMQSIYDRNKRKNQLKKYNERVKIEDDTDDSTTESAVVEDVRSLKTLAQNGNIQNYDVAVDLNKSDSANVHSSLTNNHESNGFIKNGDALIFSNCEGQNQLPDLNENTLHKLNLDNANIQNGGKNCEETTELLNTTQKQDQEGVNYRNIVDAQLEQPENVDATSGFPKTINGVNENENSHLTQNRNLIETENLKEFSNELSPIDQNTLPNNDVITSNQNLNDLHPPQLNESTFDESSHVVVNDSPEQTKLLNDTNTQNTENELDIQEETNLVTENYNQSAAQSIETSEQVAENQQLPIMDETNQEEQQVGKVGQNTYEQQQQEQYDQQQYDEHGQPLYENNLQYDESGQAIQYDANGQQIYYDENGQQIHYDQNAEQYNYDQQQYDANGQQYDENGQPVEYNQNFENYQYDENGQILNYQQEEQGQEQGQEQENVYYNENGEAVTYDDQTNMENPQEEHTNNENQQLPDGGEVISQETREPNAHKANVLELLDTESESTHNQQDVEEIKEVNESDFDFSSTSEVK